MIQRIKIAIVDDHTIFRQGFIALLNTFPDIEIVFDAANGEECIRKLNDHIIDVILLDVQMPIMNGIETATILQAKYPLINVIILTMHNDQTALEHLLSIGVKGVLQKHQGIFEIIDAIHGVIENGYYFNDMIPPKVLKSLYHENKISNNCTQTNLSKREIQIILLLSKEFTHKEIAEQLCLSTRTIDGHKENILKKTNAKNTVGIIMYALKHHFLPTN